MSATPNCTLGLNELKLASFISLYENIANVNTVNSKWSKKGDFWSKVVFLQRKQKISRIYNIS